MVPGLPNALTLARALVILVAVRRRGRVEPLRARAARTVPAAKRTPS